jgi:uncharacterized protein YdaU (DUF1376 family)
MHSVVSIVADTDVWMPVYIGDYLGSTMHLTAEQHGAYFLLQLHYWRSGPIPDDDRMLSAIAKTGFRTWNCRVGAVVKGFFEKVDGKLHHPLLERYLAIAKANVEQRRAAGRASADKRTEQRKANERPNEIPTGVDFPSHISSQRNGKPLPSTSPSSSEIEKSDLRSAPLAPELLADPISEPSVKTARQILWADGLPILKLLTGKSDGSCRGLLGQMLKDARDDCSRVMSILHEGHSMHPLANASAWLTEAARGRDRGMHRKPVSRLAGLQEYQDELEGRGSAPLFDIELTAEEMR